MGKDIFMSGEQSLFATDAECDDWRCERADR
jgi:hypothetical protein